MDTWTFELTLRRKGREDLTNVKHVEMGNLSLQNRHISIRSTTARMAEDLISYLNNENDYVPRCDNCGRELISRRLGNEYYLYCTHCGMGVKEEK